MLKKSILITIKPILAALFMVSAWCATPALAVEQQPNVAWQKINNSATLIDVRTPEEFAAGHVKGAINIPFENIVTELGKLNLAKDTEVVLYCRSGRRSGIAQSALVDQGYTATYNAGGIDSLMSAQ
ncbi:rhodanese-like domain-containing protein [Shewanella sp. MF05960]|uniref:rhodanese-like domain-containing protein n=1 Tax=Shewanella sp. MF05960 TaxID=3434874 RepID=UPI003D79968C